MDYEKKYKEALEHARQSYGTGAYDDQTLEAIFPELRESEDERIRKRIVKFVDEQYPTHGNLKEEKDKMLAYLEKQREQKTAEWSEEDKMRLSHLIRFVEKYGLQFYASTDEVIAWLKSLHNRLKSSGNRPR